MGLNKISILELVACLTDVIDLISVELQDHHQKVACASRYLAVEMGISGDRLQDIVLAAALHDIGGLSLSDRLSAVKLDFEDANSHAEKGYRLLKNFKPFSAISKIIRYHHTPWNYGKATDNEGNPIPIGSQIVLLADRISILLDPKIHLLDQTSRIIDRILQAGNVIYCTELISAFKKLAKKDCFWLDIAHCSIRNLFGKCMRREDLLLNESEMVEMVNIFSHVIDFRSSFTASHSKGVAVVSEALSRRMNFSDEHVCMMRVAGLLHDFGKLAVPSEILEKPGKLDAHEWNIIRTHAYYTDQVLSRINGFETVREWGANHHESPDGSGYPFCMRGDAISIGARIMKVADVYIALTEDRPYRNGIEIDRALAILREMAADDRVDPVVVDVLNDSCNALHDRWKQETARTTEEYKCFYI